MGHRYNSSLHACRVSPSSRERARIIAIIALIGLSRSEEEEDGYGKGEEAHTGELQGARERPSPLSPIVLYKQMPSLAKIIT